MLPVMLMQVLFKMDRSGDCQEIAIEDLSMNRELNFVNFTDDMFLQVPFVSHIQLSTDFADATSEVRLMFITCIIPGAVLLLTRRKPVFRPFVR